MCKNFTETVDIFGIVVDIVELQIVAILITQSEFSDGIAVDAS